MSKSNHKYYFLIKQDIFIAGLVLLPKNLTFVAAVLLADRSLEAQAHTVEPDMSFLHGPQRVTLSGTSVLQHRASVFIT